MANLSISSSSSLQAWQQSLNVTAQNVANANNPQYQPQRAVIRQGQGGETSVQSQPSGSPTVSFSQEAVQLSLITKGHQANLKTLQTQDQMTGSILNLVG